jgi:hypothetical protein
MQAIELKAAATETLEAGRRLQEGAVIRPIGVMDGGFDLGSGRRLRGPSSFW